MASQPSKNLLKALLAFGVPEPSPVAETLYVQALTHRSASKDNYERLEFLGDALINQFAAELLFHQAPNASEGELSRLRAAIVDQSSLAFLAQAMNLGDELNLGPGELKAGGYRRESILADAFEALLAAIYLSHGFEVAKAFASQTLTQRLALGANKLNQKDPKTELQEYLQSKALPLPKYQLLASTGTDHEPEFLVQCLVGGGLNLNHQGSGSSLKRAEQVAATVMLAAIKANSKLKLAPIK